jgi:hypothetical protein
MMNRMFGLDGSAAVSDAAAAARRKSKRSGDMEDGR